MKNSVSPRLIGVVHLPALPGAPYARSATQAIQAASTWACHEAKLFERARFDALILENFGDVPFYKDRVPPETIAAMTLIAARVREVTKLPIGINVLRNDARSALAIAAVTRADFIRVNVLGGVAATDQGLIEGEAAFLLRERKRLGAEHVRIFADVQVKHARTLQGDELKTLIDDAIIRAQADAVIISGAGTGKPVDASKITEAVSACVRLKTPLYLGSGVKLTEFKTLRARGVHGVIVSSDLRRNGRAGAPLDPKRMKH